MQYFNHKLARGLRFPNKLLQLFFNYSSFFFLDRQLPSQYAGQIQKSVLIISDNVETAMIDWSKRMKKRKGWKDALGFLFKPFEY